MQRLREQTQFQRLYVSIIIHSPTITHSIKNKYVDQRVQGCSNKPSHTLTSLPGLQQHLATYTRPERDSWVTALRSASHSTTRSHLDGLRERLRAKMAANPGLFAALGDVRNDLAALGEEMVANVGSPKSGNKSVNNTASVIGRTMFYFVY